MLPQILAIVKKWKICELSEKSIKLLYFFFKEVKLENITCCIYLTFFDGLKMKNFTQLHRCFLLFVFFLSVSKKLLSKTKYYSKRSWRLSHVIIEWKTFSMREQLTRGEKRKVLQFNKLWVEKETLHNDFLFAFT